MRSNASNERGLYRNESGGAVDDKASAIISVSIPKAGEGRHKAVEPANHAIFKKTIPSCRFVVRLARKFQRDYKLTLLIWRRIDPLLAAPCVSLIVSEFPIDGGFVCLRRTQRHGSLCMRRVRCNSLIQKIGNRFD